MLPKFSMKLEWKEFSVDLDAMETWLKANAGADYCGNSADSALTLWFAEVPSQEIQDAVQAKWDSIESDSAEATSYKSAEQLKADAAAKAASGKAKLLALGLTEAEVNALLG